MSHFVERILLVVEGAGHDVDRPPEANLRVVTEAPRRRHPTGAGSGRQPADRHRGACRSKLFLILVPNFLLSSRKGMRLCVKRESCQRERGHLGKTLGVPPQYYQSPPCMG